MPQARAVGILYHVDTSDSVCNYYLCAPKLYDLHVEVKFSCNAVFGGTAAVGGGMSPSISVHERILAYY